MDDFTLKSVSHNAFEVWLKNRYIGMVATNGKMWSATWNLVPTDQAHYASMDIEHDQDCEGLKFLAELEKHLG